MIFFIFVVNQNNKYISVFLFSFHKSLVSI